MIWVVLNVDLIGSHENISLGFVYIPPDGSTGITGDIDPFNLITESVMIQANKSFAYLCGEFYSTCTTGILGDFIEPDKCETNDPTSHSVFSGAHKQSNVDNRVNTYGWKSITRCKAAGLQILNGHVTDSLSTCFRPNGVTIVDYLLSSKKTGPIYPNLFYWIIIATPIIVFDF